MAGSARRAGLAKPHCANDLDRNDRLAYWILARPLFMSSLIFSPDGIVMISGAQIPAARALLRMISVSLPNWRAYPFQLSSVWKREPAAFGASWSH
jgi:hypothetical protein